MGTAHGQLKTGRRGPCRGRDAGRFEQRAAADHVVLGMLDAEHAQALEFDQLGVVAIIRLVFIVGANQEVHVSCDRERADQPFATTSKPIGNLPSSARAASAADGGTSARSTRPLSP